MARRAMAEPALPSLRSALVLGPAWQWWAASILPRIAREVAKFSSSDAFPKCFAVPQGLRGVLKHGSQLLSVLLLIKLNSVYAPYGPEQNQTPALFKKELH